MAMARFRRGGYIGTALDEEEPEQFFQRKRAYY